VYRGNSKRQGIGHQWTAEEKPLSVLNNLLIKEVV